MVKLVKIKVKDKKLRKYYGYAYTKKKLVEINKDVSDRTYLGTLIHELLHIFYPKESENSISIKSSTITHHVLKLGSWKKK